MRALVDTSVLIAAQPLPGIEGAVSVASIAELHFGVLIASDAARPGRLQHLAAVEAQFEPLPFDAPVARTYAELSAFVKRRGGQPRARTMDLIIAATARTHGLPLLTYDADFDVLGDLVDVRSPASLDRP